jgi:hypothetical protein
MQICGKMIEGGKVLEYKQSRLCSNANHYVREHLSNTWFLTGIVFFRHSAGEVVYDDSFMLCLFLVIAICVRQLVCS